MNIKQEIAAIFPAANESAVAFGDTMQPNAAKLCAEYCLQTSTDPEDLLIYWIAHEFQLPADMRTELQYSKLDVYTNKEFWLRVEQGLTNNIQLNSRMYQLEMQSKPLVLRTAPLIGVSYRQYCGMRYAVAHVWNASATTGVKSRSNSADSLAFGDPLASFPSIRPATSTAKE